MPIRTLLTVSCALLASSAWLLIAVDAGAGETVHGAANEPPSVAEIAAAMVEKGREQDLAVKEYTAIRRFEASNPRFKVRATLTVRTTFQEPDHYESEVIDFQGSKFIRFRVFDKILDEEKEASKKDTKPDTDILPENYDFELVGTELCGDRQCYKLAIHPKRKSKYLLEGFIWVDRQDYALARIQGSPSKRLSFWTLRTKIERQYENRAGVWMTAKIGSDSDLMIAGHSTLSITYEYEDVERSSHIPQTRTGR